MLSGPVLSILLGAVRVGPGVDHTARAVFLLQRRILEVVRIFRLLFRVEVVERAEELVKPVRGRQGLVGVAQVVLAELRGHVALRLEQLGDRDVACLQPFLRARQADLEVAGAEAALPGDERGAAGGAALLAVPVGEQRAFFGDAVDVGGFVTHHALVVGADIEPADVIAPDDKDVGFLVCRGRRQGGNHDGAHQCDRRQPCKPPASVTFFFQTHIALLRR